jgi:hypothetical protein
MKKEQNQELIDKIEGIKRKYTKGLTDKEIEDELYRELDTIDRGDIIDMVCNYMSREEKIDYVEQWHENDYEGEDWK